MSRNKDNKGDGNLVTGILFIAIGLVALLVSFFNIEIIWSEIVKFWPVLLIIIGVSMIPFNRVVKSILVIIIILLSFAFYGFNINDDHEDESVENIYYDKNFDTESIDVQEFSEGFNNNINTASVEIEYGAGELRMNPPVNELVKATNASNDIKQAFSVIYEGSHADIDFNAEGENINVNKTGTRKYTSNHFNIALNENPIYDFNISLGACDLNFDLSPYMVSDVDIQAGVCDIELKIGDRSAMTNINIESGVSSVIIGVPESSACRIECEPVLVSRDFDGFEKKASNIYETNNYHTSTKKIDISFSGAISDVKIYRY